MRRGAFVVILDSQDRALLLLRPDWVEWGTSQWAYPGGEIEPGETPVEAAIRETKEETTLDVSDLKEVKLGVDIGAYPHYTRDYKGTVQIDFEHDDWQWMTREQMLAFPLAPNVLQTYDWVIHND
jgi:8-oxo-dGTP pyrophosphatase MutT (NUDIX family)